MDFGIAGRTALVCGASRGLGFACAAALAREGVAVTLVARNHDALVAAAARIAHDTGTTPAVAAADVATEAGRKAALAACPEPDILVTNAGGPPGRDFRTLTLADWSAALAMNFLSAVELTRATIDGMAARSFGRIVNITSLTVRLPVQQLDLSNATRLAGVARQVAPQNVTVNNLLPGTIATERLRELGATADGLIAKVPMGRAGLPEEFGAACAFLCSAQAAYITAQNLLVDGGLCPFTV
jgi:3-oxoacyl-[acyl-carrier protein] reductase